MGSKFFKSTSALSFLSSPVIISIKTLLLPLMINYTTDINTGNIMKFKYYFRHETAYYK